MTERRETGRGKAPERDTRPKNRTPIAPSGWEDGDRIAKYLAHAGGLLAPGC